MLSSRDPHSWALGRYDRARRVAPWNVVACKDHSRSADVGGRFPTFDALSGGPHVNA